MVVVVVYLLVMFKWFASNAFLQDIVHSGLDYSMERTATNMMNTAIKWDQYHYHSIFSDKKANIEIMAQIIVRMDLGLDIRTAAYINSITKIFQTYMAASLTFNYKFGTNNEAKFL